MTDKEIFGTDGIRGRAGSGWLSIEGCARIGFALAKVLGKKGQTTALLAHDGRRSGPELQTALATGLAAAGVTAESAGLMPTPGLAWLTKHRHYGMGVMVSASHNPAHDNGIKVFNGEGDKLADSMQDEIESLLRGPLGTQAFEHGPRLEQNSALEDHYLRHLVQNWGQGLDLNGMTIVVDCANGAGSRCAPKALTRLGAKVIAMADRPDGENINRDCGSTHPEALIQKVRENKADLGIALDGDGDRCLLVDENSKLIDGDQILMVLGQFAAQKDRLRGKRLVATVMSNRGLHRALRSSGISIDEVGVGDRNVVEALRKQDLDLGGEQSGHVILGARNDFIGDGMVTALAVLEALVGTKKSLGALTAPFESMPQILINVPVSDKPKLESLSGLTAMVSEFEKELGQDGRILLRYSGTEKLARVMVEGPDDDLINGQANALADLIRGQIGAKA